MLNADDIAAAFWALIAGLRALLLVLLELRLAAGLCLHMGKSIVLNYTSVSDAALSASLGAASVGGPTACRHGTYLGFILGPDAPIHRPRTALAKFRDRVAQIRQLHLQLSDRVRAYTSIAFSALPFRAQLHNPTLDVLRSESAAIAPMLASPMHAAPTVLARQLRSLGAPLAFPSVGDVARASQFPILATDVHISAVLTDIVRLFDADDALLAPAIPTWYDGSAIHMLTLTRRSMSQLRVSLHAPGTLQRRFVHHILDAIADGDVRDVFRRRLAYLFGDGFAEDMPDLLVIVIRALFARCPFFWLPGGPQRDLGAERLVAGLGPSWPGASPHPFSD